MKAYQLITMAAVGFAAFSLNSCIIKQGVEAFIRDTYPGERPPRVIADVNGKPANNNWQRVDEDVLPPSGYTRDKVTYAADGLPIGLVSEFSGIVVSPYAPNYNLDYKGIPSGTKVWDPYTRKPFYIPRTYTFN